MWELRGPAIDLMLIGRFLSLRSLRGLGCPIRNYASDLDLRGFL